MLERPLTVDDLDGVRPPDRWELVDGEIVAVPWSGSRASRIGGRVYVKLAIDGERNGHGIAYPADAGFVLFADRRTVRGPDAAFVVKERAGYGPECLVALRRLVRFARKFESRGECGWPEEQAGSHQAFEEVARGRDRPGPLCGDHYARRPGDGQPQTGRLAPPVSIVDHQQIRIHRQREQDRCTPTRIERGIQGRKRRR